MKCILWIVIQDKNIYPFLKYLQSGLHDMLNTHIIPQALRMLNENLKEVTAVNKKAVREVFVLSLILQSSSSVIAIRCSQNERIWSPTTKKPHKCCTQDIGAWYFCLLSIPF